MTLRKSRTANKGLTPDNYLEIPESEYDEIRLVAKDCQSVKEFYFKMGFKIPERHHVSVNVEPRQRELLKRIVGKEEWDRMIMCGRRAGQKTILGQKLWKAFLPKQSE